ncbi:MAG: tRNA (adenosine(37)-N6)-threonylcarbamoyltransferase complex dimerization subunit type 1 TsaB [Rectinema sp.]
MNILAFDTSAGTLAAAFSDPSGTSVSVGKPGMHHAEGLMAAIDDCLHRSGAEKTDIDLVACALGPGSFTGLRIGMATAKALALALGIPWVAVPTLDCIAAGHDSFPGPVVSVLDGRKGRVYAALYIHGMRSGEWLDIAPGALVGMLDSWPEVLFAGPDSALFTEYALERPGFATETDDPARRASAMVSLALKEFEANGPAPDDSGPLYLREPEIGIKAS